MRRPTARSLAAGIGHVTLHKITCLHGIRIDEINWAESAQRVVKSLPTCHRKQWDSRKVGFGTGIA